MKRAQKYGKLSRRILRNLRSVWIRANGNDKTEGLLWYQDAHSIAQALAERYGVTLAAACGVIAALSPGNDWGSNVQDADRLIAAFILGTKLPIVGTYGRRNVAKSVRILKGEKPLDVLGGQKVRSFYGNIFDPTSPDPVTIDRHAKCAAHGKRDGETSVVSVAEYPFLARHFRYLAAEQGILPHQYQAVCWVTWRRLRGNLAQYDLPF